MRKPIPKIGLARIEASWASPMANSDTTRVRFAMWATMRYAAKIANGPSRAAIMRAVRRDEALFDRSGLGARP